MRRLPIISALYAHAGFFPEVVSQQAAVGAAMTKHMKGDADLPRTIVPFLDGKSGSKIWQVR